MKGADIPVPEPDLARQREVVDAFFSAARGGDFEALVALLDPDIVMRTDFGARKPGAPRVYHGVEALLKHAHAIPNSVLHPALINGVAGVVVTVKGRPFSVMAFTVVEGKIVAIDAIADPERVRRIAADVLAGEEP